MDGWMKEDEWMDEGWMGGWMEGWCMGDRNWIEGIVCAKHRS